MLRRILPFGLARNRAQAEPFFDQESRPAPTTVQQVAGRNESNIPSRTFESKLDNYAILPEDVLFIILGHLTVAELLVTRQCSKCFKQLTENRYFWVKFLLQPSYPILASTPPLDTLSVQELEAMVRRQFELSCLWSPNSNESPPIPVCRSRQLSMPNNESLVAMSSMGSWVAVASDLGGIYLCTPFSGHFETKGGWIRVFSTPIRISKLSVAVWGESGRERVVVMWAGQVDAEFRCGIVSASVNDLVAVQGSATGGVVLSTSDFVTSSTLQLRNPDSEIMDIAIGERYCAVVDAAHIIQIFAHRLLEGDRDTTLPRSEFRVPRLSSRKTVSLQFLPHDQFIVQSDAFIAVYKPMPPPSTIIVIKYHTPVPSTHFFGLLTQRRSSSIVPSSETLNIPMLALSENGSDVTHFDLHVSSDIEDHGTHDYRLSPRHSFSYKLVPWLQPFALGTINGGHSRLAWITSGAAGRGEPFGIALGRRCMGNGDPEALYQAPLDRAALDLGAYGKVLGRESPSGPLFAFHEGEAKLFGGVMGSPELFILEY
ncbi:hypothetical protein BDV93DRAFT_521023 [Ceratobasidium sp. AG-I]|nr:hypothetical protein BDV93DRAFT_521023 [Ceratobasidium sp. AG-I]